ncbi:hypothetical protein [Sphingobacterium haloxyli]|uniref:Uncharacterized protein n=1 Tax=Sphingobacterium haloxyli TaxID=2100533 RepID=A0A2S9J5K0_9SPHI|nr:hypothetical protein [Sphingobacterium haloxyli]PRD48030.1 hypothetical protein C5745_05825 [Sphingobacterium haloxyli]
MDEKEMMMKDIENFSDYVKAKKEKFQLTNKALGEKVGLSEGEISKIINRSKHSVSLHSFCKIAVNTGDTIDQARDQVYPHRKFKLNEVNSQINTIKERKGFGKFMQENFEKDTIEQVPSENSFDIIRVKTGISETRLKNLYYGTGAPEPFEFLLIEMAVGKNPGELMKVYVERYPVKKTKE